MTVVLEKNLFRMLNTYSEDVLPIQNSCETLPVELLSELFTKLALDCFG